MVDPWTPTVSYVQVPGRPKESNGLAVAGFALAFLGALCSFFTYVNIFGDILALVGLVLALFGLSMAASRGAGRRLSIAAITLAVFAFATSILISFTATAEATFFSPPAQASSEAALTTLRLEAPTVVTPAAYAASSAPTRTCS